MVREDVACSLECMDQNIKQRGIERIRCRLQKAISNYADVWEIGSKALATSTLFKKKTCSS